MTRGIARRSQKGAVRISRGKRMGNRDGTNRIPSKIDDHIRCLLTERFKQVEYQTTSVGLEIIVGSAVKKIGDPHRPD